MISGFLLVVALAAACLFGARFEPWSWGPGLLALAAALVAAALEPAAKGLRLRGGTGWALLLVAVAAGWFVWRAVHSPVADYARADMLLVAATAGSLLWGLLRGGLGRGAGVWWLMLGLLVALNAGVALVQVSHPAFSLLHGQRPPGFPSGLFGHYNYFSSFMIGSTLLLSGVAACGRGHGFARATLGLVCLAGMATVALSRSRGGMLGMAAGLLVFGLLMLPVLRRRWRRGFAILVCVLPLLLLGGGFAAARMLGESQQLRKNAASAEALFDNDRLLYLRVAVDTIGMHPWKGGGSQSFRWESRQAWDPAAVGNFDRDLLFVHNELMQAFTDYGLTGGGLVLAALGVVLVAGLVGLISHGSQREAEAAGAGREGVLVGALSGLAGVLVQANFCIVLHVLPNAMMLGLLAGLVLRASAVGPAVEERNWFAAAIRLACVVLAVSFSWTAWQGLRATLCLLPLERAGATGQVLRAREVAGRVREAIAEWPHASLHNDLGVLFFRDSLAAGDTPEGKALAEQAVDEYAKSLERDPHDPEPSVNRARLLSLLGRFGESEAEFERAIRLQHRMEYSFQARHFLARHFQRKFTVLWVAHDREGAKAALASAIEQAGICKQQVPVGEGGQGGRALNAQLAALDGLVRAEDAYREAQNQWMKRRPEAAMAGFLEARKWLQECRRHPETATQPDVLKLMESVEAAIHFLEGAAIKPPN